MKKTIKDNKINGRHQRSGAPVAQGIRIEPERRLQRRGTKRGALGTYLLIFQTYGRGDECSVVFRTAHQMSHVSNG